jgi:glycogen phosphorylase
MEATTPRIPLVVDEDPRTSLSTEAIKRSFLDNLYYLQAKFPTAATLQDHYMALAYTVRERLLKRWISTAETYTRTGSRTVAYLSAEFLLGPHLGNNLVNLGIESAVRDAMEELGLDLDELLEQEEEPGLGNGGLGRLAACYLDGLASQEIPAMGYGIRYEFGIFKQLIREGQQIELSDKWLQMGDPWSIPRPDWAVEVKLGGYIEYEEDETGKLRVNWIPRQIIKGIPYDIPILGYRVNTANTLRLWSAEATESFDFDAFNSGDYLRAVQEKMFSETISKVLYPNDNVSQGRRLRLIQQIFFVSCSLQDMIRIMSRQKLPLERFHEKWTLQLNDTHPAIAVAELMRLLIDEHDLTWEKAWSITQASIAYTNHTLLPEALEKWPISLFEELLPRHLEIIFEINHRFLDDVRIKFPEEPERLAPLSLIDESGERYIRMAHLACIASHSINGVAALHTRLLQESVLRDFYEMYPEKFNNKTNGISTRRFIALANPRLTKLITERIGDHWLRDLSDLRRLEPLADDRDFQDAFLTLKLKLKRELAARIRLSTNIEIEPASIFDVQAKRIHEYKRQHLDVLHIITLYNRLKADPDLKIQPRTFLFSGKAAPGYYLAKLIIRLINGVADVVNRDPDIHGQIKVVFLENFSVKTAQHIYPAADLSEQISTAGKEASGTGNMKFALNGALTIGTLDGANVEIREAVGADNFFLFGLTEAEIDSVRAQGYHPHHYYESDLELKLALDRIASGFFSKGDASLFTPLVEGLIHHDEYMVLADYRSYLDCQDDVSRAYGDRHHWARMAILNIARMGYFSADRAVREYCEDIWKIQPVPISLEAYGPESHR